MSAKNHYLFGGLLLFLALTLLPTGCGSAALGSPQNPIRMVFVPSGETQQILIQGKSVAEMLEQRTGYKIEASVATSYAAVIEAMGAKKADVAWLTAFSYVLAHKKIAAEPILVVTRQGKATYRGQIIVRADSGVQTLDQLKGKRFAFVDAASGSGHLYPKSLLLQKGYDPEHFFSQVLFAGGHDKVVIAVYNGQVDGGATFDDARTLVTTTLPDVMDRVKVIAYTEPIPNDLVSVRPGLPAEMVEKLQKALLDIAGTDEGRKVLKALYGIDGLEPTTDAAYDPVRHAAEFLNLDLEAEVAGKPK